MFIDGTMDRWDTKSYYLMFSLLIILDITSGSDIFNCVICQ